MFGISRQAVQKKIAQKKIYAIKFGNKYLIPSVEVARIKQKGVR